MSTLLHEYDERFASVYITHIVGITDLNYLEDSDVHIAHRMYLRTTASNSSRKSCFLKNLLPKNVLSNRLSLLIFCKVW